MDANMELLSYTMCILGDHIDQYHKADSSIHTEMTDEQYF